MKTERVRLEEVEHMPSLLQPGILYASQRYRTAAHLCACGCGEKIRTQLGPLGWRLTTERSGPTLYPSIGNWQKPCRSHYYITNGRVLWMGDWTDKEVGLNLAALDPVAKVLIFDARKSNGNVLDGRSRRKVFEMVRPTANVLPGYVSSFAMRRAFDCEGVSLASGVA